MKKLLTVLLTVALLFSMASFNVSAEAEIKNYMSKNIPWSYEFLAKGTNVAKSTENGETVYSFNGILNRYTSPHFNILPALKAAMGDADEAEITIAFDVRMKFTDAVDETFTSSCNVDVRAINADKSYPTPDEWTNAYEDSLGDSEALFNKSGNNVLWYPNVARIPLKNTGEWYTVVIDMYFDREQLYNAVTGDTWLLGFDTLGGLHQVTPEEIQAKYDSYQLKNIGVYLTEEYLDANATPEPTPEPTPVPTPTPVATPTPDATATPDASQNGTTDSKPTATAPADSNDDSVEDAGLPWLWIAVGAVVVVGGIVAVVVIVSKKKKAAPEAEEAEEE